MTTPQIPAEHVPAARDVFATDLRGLDAAIDYLWAVAYAAGRESAFDGGSIECALICNDPSHSDHVRVYMTGDAQRLRDYAAKGAGCFIVARQDRSRWLPTRDDDRAAL
jgi:hypothetical protein